MRPDTPRRCAISSTSAICCGPRRGLPDGQEAQSPRPAHEGGANAPGSTGAGLRRARAATIATLRTQKPQAWARLLSEVYQFRLLPKTPKPAPQREPRPAHEGPHRGDAGPADPRPGRPGPAARPGGGSPSGHGGGRSRRHRDHEPGGVAAALRRCHGLVGLALARSGSGRAQHLRPPSPLFPANEPAFSETNSATTRTRHRPRRRQGGKHSPVARPALPLPPVNMIVFGNLSSTFYLGD